MSRESSMRPDSGQPAGDVVAEIRTTFPTRQDAVACGTRLVEQGLAACVQIEGPLTSVYRWHDAVQTAEEFACRWKTIPFKLAECEVAIRAAHPYDTPEILVSFCRGSADYAAWVQESIVADRERRS